MDCIFTVDIDEGDSVAVLLALLQAKLVKDIKERFDVSTMKLYFAKRRDRWLNWVAVEDLKQRGLPRFMRTIQTDQKPNEPGRSNLLLRLPK